MSNQNRAQIVRTLILEIRRFIANAVVFNQRLADKLGLNATDYQFLNLLDLGGSTRPADLAKLTGLTTGGVTVVLDRLEKGGFIRRERNPHDRRSLKVSFDDEKKQEIMALYKGINVGMDRIFSGYDDEQLALILDFFLRSNRMGDHRDPPAEEETRAGRKDGKSRT